MCQTCSKPIASGNLVWFEAGELFHVRCRSRTLEIVGIEGAERAAAARAQAARLIAEAEGRRKRLAGSPVRSCPICRQAATVTDWRPSVDWLVVEGCDCGDFFATASLFETRLPKLLEAERRELGARIRWFRAKGAEAWCTTSDGTQTGQLVILDERPDRPR